MSTSIALAPDVGNRLRRMFEGNGTISNRARPRIPRTRATMTKLGAWRSLVARTVRVGEVPGSNPGAPIDLFVFAGLLWGGERSRIRGMDSRYGVEASGSLQLLRARSPCKSAVAGNRSGSLAPTVRHPDGEWRPKAKTR